MPANTNPIFPAIIRTVGLTLSDASDPDSFKILFDAGNNGSRVDKILASSNLATPVELNIEIQPAEGVEVSIPISTLSVAPGAGYTVAMANLMPPELLDADDRLFLGTGTQIMVKPAVSIPADKYVTILVMACDY